MLIYLDESYDSAHDFFLLGALYVPDSTTLHRDFKQAKIDEGFILPSGEVKEIKYSQITRAKLLRIAKAGTDIFLRSNAWFACIVVDQRPESGWSLASFGRADEGNAIKRARSYTYFAQLLLHNSMRGVTDGVLLADRMTRTQGDDFLQAIREAFSEPSIRSSHAPALSTVVEADTALEIYHVGQIGDLLTGAVLNDLVEPQGARASFKRAFKRHVKQQLGVPSFGRDYWNMPADRVATIHPNFQVWHWDPEKPAA